MTWLDDALNLLAKSAHCGYGPRGPAASEPTALAAIALTGWKRLEAAEAKLRWLAEIQSDDGSVGVGATEKTPSWPTSLATLAWVTWQRRTHEAPPRFAANIRRAVDWLLQTKGTKLPRHNEGHNGSLVGWPWIEDTHSWIEPTAWSVLALKATGRGAHPRTREGVRLLIDRLLPGGGCNYGNTVVLGQRLRPHVQPTGLALLALAGERDGSGRIGRSIEYLHNELCDRTTPASLSYALLGLAAHGCETCEAEGWLQAAAGEAMKRESPLELALLALAATRRDSPLIQLSRRDSHEKHKKPQKRSKESSMT